MASRPSYICRHLTSILVLCMYSVMQSDRNSLKIDTFWEAITSELMIWSWFWKLLLVRIRVYWRYYLVRSCLNVRLISCRLMKSDSFRTVPIWLHHTVLIKTTYSELADIIFFRRRTSKSLETLSAQITLDWNLLIMSSLLIFLFSINGRSYTKKTK